MTLAHIPAAAPESAAAHVTGTAVLQLSQVARTYPGQPPVHALLPLDLTVRAGEYVAIVGPSGSGKSTLLNLLGLLDRPTGGSIQLAGVDASLLKERERTALRGRNIGFVFQAFHLLAHRTAVENVALAQLYIDVKPAARRAAAVEALVRVGLGHRLHALPSTMSGGERQRVAIARALVNAPALILCDEPTGNLDTTTARSVMDLLEELNRTGVTLLVITHDPEVAGRARRSIRIRDGRLQADPPSGPGAAA
ncbi:ABC transporter ATP-binding protein [Streptacidiphilus sp. N1-3]|uniref:ABC transporter ATP-binding protein n=1 Tax=Streptacidiphilus alkalitolerans TaxID=3342712 RepID=A0ABV6WZD6_9ACTN